ncbi:MAG TPA: Rrf2 family transcriptional regulator [Anaerohalosphaeraceae bacterium]|nr:Rrf2 family transcriptional regulator [Anaerohalosphaeraceae bacterium]HOL88165.1 Rrf2 family transcriptional regulator [Anaerohalosphaeraceae bacterium]HPP56024.1 Rrf2 family transcriptional regulator [Anaerohalosphaeraceae bacterium]
MTQTFEYFQISQKSRYALRALLHLALLDKHQPAAVSKLAQSQQIPTRFLEVILNELRQGGFVLAIRGKHGGYLLAKHPREISLGQIIRFLESSNRQMLPAYIDGAPSSEKLLFEKINTSISLILDSTSLEDLAAEEQKRMSSYIANYVI